MFAREMAAVPAEETTALGAGSDVPPGETNKSDPEKKENGLSEPETEQTGSSAEPKMDEVDAEAAEEKPATTTDKAARDVGTDGGASAVTRGAAAGAEGPEERLESRPSLEEGSEEHPGDDTVKDAKEEPDDDSRCSVMDTEKTVSNGGCEEGDKAGGGGDKRRTSVEISSSDGEPLSRMDSEDRSVVLGP